jgi:isopenicillin-N epimerase
MGLRQHPISDEDAAFWLNIRKQFYLRDDTTYLQGGSVGPSARPTIEKTIDLLRAFESDPLNNRDHGLLRPIIESARGKLGRFVGADPDRLALLPNTTMGMNLPAQGLKWERGREILMSDQEYPAVKNLFEYIAERDGLTISMFPLPTPPDSPQDIVDAYADRFTDRTCLMICSHVYCTTGLVAPVGDLTGLAHKHGALAIIDGAHALGMVPVDLAGISPDFYVSSCHKWLLTPKGVGMVYIDASFQNVLRPLIIGHNNKPTPNADRYDKLGTADLTHYAGMETAIDYQLDIGWNEKIRPYCLALARYLKERIVSDIAGSRLTIPMDTEMSGYLTSFTIEGIDSRKLMRILWDEYKIQTQSVTFNGISAFRISTHFYDTFADIDRFVDTAIELIRTRKGLELE